MTTQDLTQLPAPTVVEAMDFETILASHRADLIARYQAAAEVIGLESEPLAKLLEAHALRELIYRQRVNDAARAYLLAYQDEMDTKQRRRWHSWEDYMREWSRREDFRERLPHLLRGEDPDFAAYIQRLAEEEARELQG